MAQNPQPVRIHLTEKDGLPDIEFYDILEDNEGFIWLAADKGLYRYDGRHYQLFTHPLKQGRSLFYLTLDAKGRVWCTNLAGQFFYVENNQLQFFNKFDAINSLSAFSILNNHLIITTENQIFSVAIDSKKIVNTIDDIDEFFFLDLNNASDGVYFNKKGIPYYTTDETLKIDVPVLNETPIFNRVERGYTKFFKYQETVYVFKQNLKAHTNKLYALKNQQLNRIILPKELLDLAVIHVYEIDQEIWIVTSKGFFVTTLKDQKLVVKDVYLKGTYTTDVLVDANQNYWITTLKNGVFVIPNKNLKRVNTNGNNSISSLSVGQDQSLYFSTENHEVYNYNVQTNQLNPLKTNFINNVYDISDNPYTNAILMVSKSKSINYNTQTQNAVKGSLIGTKSISPLTKNTYLVSVFNALGIYDEKQDTVKVIRKVRSFNSVLSNTKKTAYASFIDGLAKVDLQTKTVTKIKNCGLPIYASKLKMSKTGVLWVATNSNGLLGIKKDSVLYRFNRENGLNSILINAIDVNANSVWLATDKGLQNYNYKTNDVLSLNQQDGVNSYNINAIKIIDDTVFFSSNTGLFSFNSKKITPTHKLLKPYFTGVSIKERDTILKNTYHLKQTDSEIKISFNTNGFQSHKFVKYEYQLQGFNAKWIPVEDELDFVKFNTLPKGDFVFKLRARNTSSKTVTAPIAIQLKVTLPFYKTWWFYLVLTLLVTFLVRNYYTEKTKRLKSRQKQALETAKINQELVFSQLENLRSQMNPHFIFNALNSIQDYIILNEKKLARVYLVKFSRLIRTYLDQSQKNEVSLSDEINALKLYLELEKDRFDDDFEFHFNVDSRLNLETTFVPSLFIQPYVENAIKHGLLHKKDNKKLHLHFYQQDHVLICEIVDNGVGRKATALINKNRPNGHTSFASNANQKRVALLNKFQREKIELHIVDLYDANHNPTGTKVIIKMTLPND